MKQLYLRRKVDFVLCLLLIFFGGLSGYAEERCLLPVGMTVGVTLDMEGVTIVDTTDVEDYDGKHHTPAKDAGIRAGDLILSINGTTIESAKQLEELVNSEGENPLAIVCKHNGKEESFTANAALSNQDGHYRLGVWIKDAASGIGTVTYFDPETKEFGALGHGISETAEEEPIPVRGGELWQANIVSIQKGSKGQPGELIGVFAEGKEKLGEVNSNTVVGLKGVWTEEEEPQGIMSPIPVAARSDVHEGAAEILANIEEDRIESYTVEIQKINRDEANTKGMVIKVTDQTLKEKTGGIVQGMSGSPILQDGKLVGAVTHVFVNDPTRGYGIFMDHMLD